MLFLIQYPESNFSYTTTFSKKEYFIFDINTLGQLTDKKENFLLGALLLQINDLKEILTSLDLSKTAVKTINALDTFNNIIKERKRIIL